MNYGLHATPGGEEMKHRSRDPQRCDDDLVGPGRGPHDSLLTTHDSRFIRHGHGQGHRRGPEAGYTMVMFVMVIAVMSISMGVAVQTAEFQMQREKEAELIFRGQQYVEAIRLYKLKYGRYPMQLKEIYEAKPKVIRQKWKDPITDSEDWGIIFLGQEGRTPGQQGRQLAGPGGQRKDPRSGQRAIETQPPGGGTGTGQSGSQDSKIDPRTGLPRSAFDDTPANRKMGPIVGVHSKSTDEAIKIYEGRTTYSEWKFVYKEENQQGRGRTRPRQPPRGWHPGDKLDREGDSKPGPGSGGGPPGPGGGGPPGPGGGDPPPPIATIPRP